jgi:hypothetical protein
MKKTFTAFLAIATLFLSLFAFYPIAHGAVSCTQVDASNFVECCSGDNSTKNNTQCNAYLNSNASTSTSSTSNTASTGCSTINKGNYESCCTGENSQQNNSQCDAYDNSNATAAAANTCGTITSSNYNSCCPASNTANKTQCNAYEVQAAATTSVSLNCSSLNAANSGPCCTSPSTDALKEACYYYTYNQSTNVTGQTGSQTTTALNGTTNTAYGTYGGALAPSEAKAITACTSIKFNTLLDIAIWAKCLIGAVVIPGIFTLAFVVFLWGVFKFIRSPDLKDKNEGKQFIYMGLIGLFVMVSVWGIIKIASTTLGIDSTVPALQTDYLSTSKASK